MTTAEAVSAWVDAWSEGWARHDAAGIAARYAIDGAFRSHPFRTTGRGRQAAFDFAQRAFAEEQSARFAFALRSSRPTAAPRSSTGR